MERMDQKLELVLRNLLIELIPCKCSLRNGANLSQSVLNKIHTIVVMACVSMKQVQICTLKQNKFTFHTSFIA